MKTRIYYHVDETTQELLRIPVILVTKLCSGLWQVIHRRTFFNEQDVEETYNVIFFARESEMEIPVACRPRPRKIPFVDPLEIMNRGTTRICTAWMEGDKATSRHVKH